MREAKEQKERHGQEQDRADQGRECQPRRGGNHRHHRDRGPRPERIPRPTNTDDEPKRQSDRQCLREQQNHP